MTLCIFYLGNRCSIRLSYGTVQRNQKRLQRDAAVDPPAAPVMGLIRAAVTTPPSGPRSLPLPRRLAESPSPHPLTAAGRAA
jgi:hypothetical protein